MTNLLIVYYSAYGHIYQMARKAANSVEEMDGVNVKMVKVPEFEAARKNLSTQDAYNQAQQVQANVPEATFEDLKWADGIIWGIPTRFGNMPAQIKQFLDSAGTLWQEGALEGKPAGIISSSNTTHGGQETTIITSLVPLMHLGMIIVGLPYSQNPELMTSDGIGGTPYGASTLAGPDGSRTPTDEELTMGVRLASRVASIAGYLKE